MPKETKSRKQSVRWGATLWSETYKEFDANILYYMKIVQHECPDTHKLHWHAYLQFKQKKTMQQVKTYLDDNEAHLIPLFKDDTTYIDDGHDTISGPFEYGRPTYQGQRNDLLEVAKKIKEGGTMSTIADQHPDLLIKYAKGLQTLMRVSRDPPPTFRGLFVQLFWGETGTGKTRTAYEFDKDLYAVPTGGRWWDGYDLQKTILIDDFDPNDWKLSFLLRVLDGYPLQVEFKGGFTWVYYTRVYITSNIDPMSWYEFDQRRDALFRRINEITPFHKNKFLL